MSGIGMFAKDSNVGPSPSLWNHLPRDCWYDPAVAVGHYDDFANFPSLTAGTHTTLLYNVYLDVGVTMGVYASGTGIEVAGNDADNDASTIRMHGVPFQIEASKGLLVFEARIKKAAITDNSLAFFLGLADLTVAADNDTLGDDECGLADRNLVGFHLGDTSGSTFEGEKVNFSWKADGQTSKEYITDLTTLTADTYVKLGFVYRPQWPAASRMRVYVNGVEHATKVTAALIDADAGAAYDFPSDVMLGMLWGTKVGAAAESKAQLHWWACYQLRA